MSRTPTPPSFIPNACPKDMGRFRTKYSAPSFPPTSSSALATKNVITSYSIHYTKLYDVGVRDIFGEGIFFLVNLWEKGPLWLTLSAEGRAGHGSRPSADDAPARLSRAMARIAELREQARLTDPVREMMRALFAQGRIDLDPDTIDGSPDDAPRLEEFISGHPEIDALLRNTFAVTTLTRITSYNVCYTKLLRQLRRSPRCHHLLKPIRRSQQTHLQQRLRNNFV